MDSGAHTGEAVHLIEGDVWCVDKRRHGAAAGFIQKWLDTWSWNGVSALVENPAENPIFLFGFIERKLAEKNRSKI
jgi:hypothetical protein